MMFSGDPCQTRNEGRNISRQTKKTLWTLSDQNLTNVQAVSKRSEHVSAAFAGVHEFFWNV